MTKKVWLEGHPVDLQALANLLSSGDTRVLREGDQFYLTSTDIENPPDGVKPYIVAKGLLPAINGLARVASPDFRPVELSGKYTDGGSTTIFPPAATLELRGGTPTVTVTDPDGNIVFPGPSPWPDRFALARSHPDLVEALEVLGGTEGRWWSDLYWVFEIICDAISGRNKLYEFGWASRPEIKSFTGSAQKARHARSSAEARSPMSLAEAHDFVNRLLVAWLSTPTTYSGE